MGIEKERRIKKNCVSESAKELQKKVYLIREASNI